MLKMAYSSPVDPASYGFLGIMLCIAGLALMAAFFVVQMDSSSSGSGRGKDKLSPGKEVLLALLSSLFLGFGCFFASMWAGLYF